MISIVENLIAAAKGGHWGVFAGFIIALLVWLFRKLNISAFIPPKADKWVAAGVGILAYIGISLTTGMVWYNALWQGFLVGAAAVGLWELLLKKYLRKEVEAPKEAVKE